MSPLAVVTLAGALVAAAALAWLVHVLIDIGSDGLGAGPWRRPPPRQTHSRLPADFVGLWSLFGSKSINSLAGSRESAVRRLDRLEALLRGRPVPDGDSTGTPPPAGAGPTRFDDGWLERRLDELETLAGLRPRPGGDAAAAQDPPNPASPPGSGILRPSTSR